MKLDAQKGLKRKNFHIVHEHETIHRNNGVQLENKIWATNFSQ